MSRLSPSSEFSWPVMHRNWIRKEFTTMMGVFRSGENRRRGFGRSLTKIKRRRPSLFIAFFFELWVSNQRRTRVCTNRKLSTTSFSVSKCIKLPGCGLKLIVPEASRLGETSHPSSGQMSIQIRKFPHPIRPISKMNPRYYLYIYSI